MATSGQKPSEVGFIFGSRDKQGKTPRCGERGKSVLAMAKKRTLFSTGQLKRRNRKGEVGDVLEKKKLPGGNLASGKSTESRPRGLWGSKRDKEAPTNHRKQIGKSTAGIQIR